MKNTSSPSKPLHDALVRMAAQSVLLLSPSGRILEQTGDIRGLDYDAAGILLAQVMMAFQNLIAGGKTSQIFFAYQDSHYHYAGTGTYRQPFLISIYHSGVHRPPVLGTIKYCIKQAYARMDLSDRPMNAAPLDMPPQAALQQTLSQHYLDQWTENDPELQRALDEVAEELNARLVLAIDETGAVVSLSGNAKLLDVAHIGALSANSLSAFAELNLLDQAQSTEDPFALVVIEGPKAVVLLARDAGPYAFLMVLPPKGVLGMGRLLLKDLLRREWTVMQAQWEDSGLSLDMDEGALTSFWGE